MKHSATSMKTWENCPRLFKAKYIDKIIPWVPSPASERGIKIHAELEEAVKTGTEPEVWTPKGLVQKLHAVGATTEGELAVDENLHPVPYKSPKAWLRGIIDVRVVRKARALVVDWKTGKVRPDKIQADVYTTLIQATENVEKVDFKLVYVDQEQVVDLTRDTKSPYRVKLLAEKIEADRDYLPQPGWLCRFCDFTACRYNEKKGA